MAIMSAKKYESLEMLSGGKLPGPWVFVSDGSIGAYPRFVNERTGRVVFLHAVESAMPLIPVTEF